MQRIRGVVVCAALIAVGFGGEVSAHMSTYCGHGTNGTLWVTKWTHHTTGMTYPYHFNFYNHYQWPSWNVQHTGATACPGGV